MPDSQPGQHGRPRRAPASSVGSDGRLPGDLAQRFDVVRILSSPGAPASVLLVREPGHGERVLKLHPPSTDVDAAVAERLPLLHRRTRHLVEVFEVGRAGDVGYELMEYVAGGDLRTRLDREQRGLEPALVRAVAEQLTDALTTLHEAGIWHRDVKPRNVLIRSLVRLDVALADFGISRLPADPWEFRSGPGTPVYLAPEVLTAEFDSAARDWWALGMTVVELVIGRHPFLGLDIDVVRLSFAAGRGIDLAEVAALAPPDIFRLCRGLLRQDYRRRWGAGEVRAWLAGEEPEVPPDEQPAAEEPAAPVHPFRLDDHRTARGKVALAVALAEHWEWAAARFFTSPGPEWQRLRDWLFLHDDRDRDDLAGRDELVRRVTGRLDPPDVLLLRLLRWLHPTAPPVYRHRMLTAEALPVLARQATAPPVPEDDSRLVVAGLWRHRVLQLVADGYRGAELADADRRWRGLHDRWRSLAAGTAEREPRFGPALLSDGDPDSPVDPLVLAYLLWLATDAQGAGDWLRDRAASVRRDLPQPVGWYDELLRGSTALDALCCLLLAAQARFEAEQVAERVELERAERAEQRRLRLILLRRADRDEWYRRQERPIAFGWAVVGLALVVIAWAVVIAICDVVPFAGGGAVDGAWACAALSTVVLAAAEGWLVAEIGGPYHPRFSLAALLVGAGGGAGRATLRRGGWVGLLLAGVAVAGLVAATAFLPWLLPLATAAAHLAWTRARHRRWAADRAERAAQLEQARRELREAREGPGPGAGQPDPPDPPGRPGRSGRPGRPERSQNGRAA